MIMGTVKSINPTSAYSGRSVWIVATQNATVFKADGNPRLLVITPDSEVEFNVTKGKKTGFILKKGEIKESKDFKVAANLDKAMEFYTQSAVFWGNMISKNVESMRGRSYSSLRRSTMLFMVFAMSVRASSPETVRAIISSVDSPMPMPQGILFFSISFFMSSSSEAGVWTVS